MKKRKRTKKFHPCYKRFVHSRNTQWHECFYCGEPADTVDHYPPISRVSDYRALGKRWETYITVSCCNECNLLLNSTLQETLSERAEALKDKLEIRLRRDLNPPEWFEDEIEDLGPSMRKLVEGAMRRRERARRRIDYYDGINAWTMALADYRVPGDFELV